MPMPYLLFLALLPLRALRWVLSELWERSLNTVFDNDRFCQSLALKGKITQGECAGGHIVVFDRFYLGKGFTVHLVLPSLMDRIDQTTSIDILLRDTIIPVSINQDLPHAKIQELLETTTMPLLSKDPYDNIPYEFNCKTAQTLAKYLKQHHSTVKWETEYSACARYSNTIAHPRHQQSQLLRLMELR
jgi:hypothetical protein